MLVFDVEHPVAALAFAPDGTRLVVARANWYPCQLWPSEVVALATGERLELSTPDIQSYPALAVHPSGRLALFVYWHGYSIYAPRQRLSVVSLVDGTGQLADGPGADGVIVSPDGKRVITTAEDGSRHFMGYRCDPDAGTCAVDWCAEPHVVNERLGGFLGAGDRFVTVGSHRIVVRRAETGEVLTAVRFPSGGPISPVVSPDGSRLAVRSSTQFYVWDTATWKKRFQLPTEGRPLVEYAFHPTRPIFAAIQGGQTLVKFFDADTGKLIQKFQWKLGEMRAVCFSPDGTLAAAGGVSGKVVVWDVD